MKILITGFNPFGGEKINPSYEAVKLLDNHIDGAEIVKLQLPTSFQNGFAVLKSNIDLHNPDFVLCCGQAGGICGINLEKIAVNFYEGTDNENSVSHGQLICENSADGLFSTIDVNMLSKKLKTKGLPIHVSYTAGVYVCNYVLYNVLHYARQNNLHYKAMFIHVPFLPQQVLSNAKTPSLPLDYIKHCLHEIIAATINISRE